MASEKIRLAPALLPPLGPLSARFHGIDCVHGDGRAFGAAVAADAKTAAGRRSGRRRGFHAFAVADDWRRRGALRFRFRARILDGVGRIANAARFARRHGGDFAAPAGGALRGGIGRRFYRPHDAFRVAHRLFFDSGRRRFGARFDQNAVLCGEFVFFAMATGFDCVFGFAARDFRRAQIKSAD